MLQIEVISYDEFNDTFYVNERLGLARSEHYNIDAADLSMLVGESNEPAWFIGKTFEVK